MADAKISQLPASTTPLAGTEVVPIVQSGTTKKVSIENVLTSTQPSGVANGVVYLNGSKISSSNAGLTFDGTNFGVGTTSPSSYGKMAVVGTVAGNVSGGVINLDTNAASQTTFYIQKNTDVMRMTTLFGIGLIGSQTNMPVYLQTNSATCMEISTGGDVTVNTGNLVIGTDGKGIDFTATPGTGTSELLDDYEEGTWTPGVNFGGNNVDMVVTTSGNYTKVGRLVTLRCSVTFSAKGTSTGTFQITGLPFTVATKGAGTCGYNFGIVLNAYTMFSFTAQGTVIVMFPLGYGDAANQTFFADTTDIQDITITYMA